MVKNNEYVNKRNVKLIKVLNKLIEKEVQESECKRIRSGSRKRRN